MSKILVDTIDTRSGTTNLTIGSTNSSTVTFENGAVTGHMYPAFSVKASSDQTGIADNSITLAQLNSEDYDTDSAFNTSTYKFTVPSGKAGKYYFYGQVSIKGTSGADRRSMYVWLYKNGSGFSKSGYFLYDKHFEGSQENVPCIARTFDLSVGDTIELRAQCFDGSSGTYIINGNTNTYLTGYRIGS